MRQEPDRQGDMTTPLHEHAVLRSGSFEETRSFLRQKSLEIQPTDPRSLSDGFCAAIDGAYLTRMYVGFMAYSAALEISAVTPLESDYGIHLPIDGRLELRDGKRAHLCDAGRAVVVSPADRVETTVSECCQRLLLSINRHALDNHLATMIGDLPGKRLVFAPRTGPGDSRGQRLANAVRYAAVEFARKESVTGNDVVVAQFEQFLMTLLLMTQPNNYSEALSAGGNGVRPKDVKRAIDYIHGNLGHAITLDDLVGAARVPGRTLYQHFHDFVGTSPMGYVKRVRFEQVRDDLKKSKGDGTITEIAGRWGFTHMGRFAAEYRRRFGELPSVTAGRRRPQKG